MENRNFEWKSDADRKKDDFLSKMRKIRESLASDKKYSLVDVYRYGRVKNLVDCSTVFYNQKKEEKMEGFGGVYGRKIVDIKTRLVAGVNKSWLYDDLGNLIEMTDVNQGELIEKKVESIRLTRTKQAFLTYVGTGEVRVGLWNKEKRVSEVYYIKKIAGKLQETFLYGEKDEIWLGMVNIDMPNKDKCDLPFVIQKRSGSIVLLWKDGNDWKKIEEKVAEKNLYWNCVACGFPIDKGLVAGEGGEARLVVYKKCEGKWKKDDLWRNTERGDKVKYEDMVDLVQVKFLSEDGNSFISVNQRGVLLVWQYLDRWVVKYRINFGNNVLDVCCLTNNRFVVGEERGNISIWQGSEKLDLWNRKNVGFCPELYRFDVLNDGCVVAYGKDGSVCSFSGLSVSGRFL